MLFAEKKIATGYKYTCEDIFGLVTLTCNKKLDGDTLDAAVTALLGVNAKAEHISGHIPYEGTNIYYTFKKTPLWQEDEEQPKEYKQGATTLTNARGVGYWIRRVRLKIIKILLRLQRYGVALLEAWKNSE